MAGDHVTITVRANNGQAVAAFRDTEGRLRDMRGRFVSESTIMARSMDQVSKSFGRVRGSIIPLATSAVPALAALSVTTLKAASTAAGAVTSLAAFGIAAAGQVPHLARASEAQNKYREAVIKSGRGSQQAAEAQEQITAAFARMPQATQRAAVQLQTFKQAFREWSDDLAGFTMSPVEKSLVVFEQLLPKLTPMVRGASAQLDRLVTAAGGGLNSPAIDDMMKKFDNFSTGAMRRVTDGVIHLSRVLSEGGAGDGPIKALMDYAKQNGPAVRETLSSLAGAVTTLVKAAADAGPGMLTLVKAAADLVAALPPGLVTVLMQTAVGLKLVTMAGAGIAAVSRGIASLGASLVVLRAASVAAGGGLTGLRAAFAGLGTAAKASIGVAGLAAVALGINELAENARGAPPDIDKLTTSLKGLAATGDFSGELRKSFGDFDGLIDKMRKLQTEQERAAKSDGFEIPGIAQFSDWVGSLGNDLIKGEEGLKALEDDFKSVDGALAQLASSGNTEAAAAGFKMLQEAGREAGYSTEEINALLPGYSSYLADVAHEQELTAQSMGVFGQAAQDTSAKLAAQKQSADGLRASILALNDVNRDAHDAQTRFEGALDSLTASFAEHGATLNADTEAGRANRDAMSQAAKSQDELIASGVAAGDSLESMTKKSESLRGEMMLLATKAFKGNTEAATEYVNTLIGTPGEIKTLVKLERQGAIAGLEEVRAAVQDTPDSHEVTVSTLNGSAIAALEAVGLKTEQLPDGRTRVFTANGQSLGNIGTVSTAMNNLNGKTATTYIVTVHRTTYDTPAHRSFRQSERDFTNRSSRGGLLRRYAEGGPVQMAPNGLVSGPGTGTSDSILAAFASGATGLISDTEYVVNAASTRKYLPLLEAINSNRLRVTGFAKGGLTQAAKDARGELRGQLGISHFGRRAGYQNTPFEKSLGKPQDLGSLVSSLNSLRGDIGRAFSGRTESRLLKQLEGAGRQLITYEKQLTKVNASLEKAKDKLNDLKSAASQLRESVRSGVLSAANITRGAGGDKPVTVASIMSGLTASRDKSTAFARALKDLQKKGVDKGLIQQIAEAGIEGGGLETAGALLAGSESEIQSMNGLQAQIAKAAKSAGDTAADAMYGAGIRAAEGLVKGLQEKQDAVERQMMRIAKGMEKSIKRALGIRSPSKVMEPVGDFAMQGVEVGWTKRLAKGNTMLSGKAPAWASMLNQPRTSTSVGRGAATGARQPEPIVLEIRSSGSDIDEFLLRALRKAINVRGGNAQIVLTGRTT